jgi:hypothetical protein
MKNFAWFMFSLVLTGSASAQYAGPYVPNPTPLNYLPNYYNRTQQPLSPYLNLMRGNNPSLNYYYGTRPGTYAGGVNVFGQPPVYQPFVGPLGGGFLPQAGTPNDGETSKFQTGGQPVTLTSPGRPVVYGNTFGNHGSYASVYANRGAMPSPQRGPGSAPPPRR